MRNPRVFIDIDLAEQQTIELPKEVAHHLTTVLRLKKNNPLRVFNGKGGYFDALITACEKRSATIQILKHHQDNCVSPIKSHIGLAMSLGDRMDYAIQKATELGMSELTPLITERTELKIKADKIDKKIARWQQIAISACEQCKLNMVPVIHPPVNIDQWLASQTNDLKLVLHHRNTTAISSFEKPSSLSLLIGPEGGLSDNEINDAQQHGFNAVVFGPRVLRTETAPVVALTACQLLWGDFN